MKYRLAIIDSHPIQYRAPFFRKIAGHPQIDLTVYYRSRFGTDEYLDKEFGIRIKWDVPLLDGYNYRFLRNYLPQSLPQRPRGIFCPGIIEEIKRERPDAVILYGYSTFNNWFVSTMAHVYKIPVIFTGETVLYTRPSWLKSSLLRVFFHYISAYLYIGAKSREFYKYFNISDKRLFFAPYSVDNDYFISRVRELKTSREAIKKKCQVPVDLPAILYIGKLLPRKCPLDLLKAFEKVQHKASLVFVGEGESRPVLGKYMHEKNMKNVFFFGFKNQSELPEFYAMGALFVLPSSHEPWGLAINEAMCAGLPIITTNRVAAGYDLVLEGKNGYVVDAGDSGGLEKAIESLISDSGRRADMGDRSSEIISQWNYDRCVDAVIRALQYVKSSH